MIIGITGNPRQRLGSGKTLTLTFLLWYLSQRLGYRAVGNYDVKIPNFTRITHPRELRQLDNAIIGLDDLYRWLGASGGTGNIRVRKLLNIFAGESRHHSQLIIYVSSRMVDMIYANLRAHTDLFLRTAYRNKTVYIEQFNAIGEPIPARRYGVIPPILPPNVVTRVFKLYNHTADVEIIEDF